MLTWIGRLAPCAIVLWVAWRVAAVALLPNLMRGWRAHRHVRVAGGDPLVAAVAAHHAIAAPDGALAVALVLPDGTREFYAGRINGRGSPTPDADTWFELGSLTKTFTATLLLVLEREGRVSGETPLDELLLPDERPGRQSPRAVNLVDLATHRSGLPRLPRGLAMLAGALLSPGQPYRFLDQPALTRSLRGRPISGVGQFHRYSNLGYMLLGMALARRVGRSYGQALSHFVLSPLRLDGVSSMRYHTARTAQPHSALGWRTPIWHWRDDLQGAGGLLGTLDGARQWLLANMRQEPPIDAGLHAASADSATHGCQGIALGWQVSGDGDGRLVWHNGATGGSRSFLGFMPALGVGIVVLCSQAAPVDGLALQLLRCAVAAQAQPNQSMPAHASANQTRTD